MPNGCNFLLIFKKETLNILFSALYINNDYLTILKVYEICLEKNFPISYTIFDLIMETLRKDNEHNLLRHYSKPIKNSVIRDSRPYLSLLDDEESAIIDQKEITEFSKRTFKNKDEVNIFADEITFMTQQNCLECQSIIDIDELCALDNTLEGTNIIKKDMLWANCPVCKCSILPKLEVILGTDIENNDELDVMINL